MITERLDTKMRRTGYQTTKMTRIYGKSLKELTALAGKTFEIVTR